MIQWASFFWGEGGGRVQSYINTLSVLLATLVFVHFWYMLGLISHFTLFFVVSLSLPHLKNQNGFRDLNFLVKRNNGGMFIRLPVSGIFIQLTLFHVQTARLTILERCSVFVRYLSDLFVRNSVQLFTYSADLYGDHLQPR